MPNPRLIILDGIPGTGKSTMAQYLYFQFKFNGYRARWFHEEELWHPLFYPQKNIQKIDNPPELQSFMENWPLQWNRLFTYLSEHDLLILTSYLFEDGARVLFANNIGCSKISEFLQIILTIISSLDPFLVFLYSSDVKKNMLDMWLKRGSYWMRYFCGVDELTPFAKVNDLHGTSASLILWSEFQNCCMKILKENKIKHTTIDIRSGEWPLFYKKLIEDLGLMQISNHEVIKKEIHCYCGFYLSEAEDEISFRILPSENGGLKADFLWPDIVLIADTENSFWMRSFPLLVVFEDYDGERYNKIRLEGIDLYHLTQRTWVRNEIIS